MKASVCFTPFFGVLYPKQQNQKVSRTQGAAEQIPQPYSRAEESARELNGLSE